MRPRAGYIIQHSDTPIINYTNKFMNSQAAVNAVSEAVKRYTYPVMAVVFENNGLKSNDSIKIITSF